MSQPGSAVAPADASAALRLGTRGGDLALWQARTAARLIAEAHPGLAIDSRVIRTTGDRASSTPIAAIGGTGVFTREIEQALRDGRIDVAVHSLKDLPTRLASDLELAAVLERGDPRDALVAPAGARLASLPPRARLGTSSPRRRAQVLACRPDLVALDIRGNVPTRIEKLDRGDYDALLLAAAGLHRLGLDGRIAEYLDPDIVMPAPGQGAIAIEARAADARVLDLLAAVDHGPTHLATMAERACLAGLEGGCQVPVGVLGSWTGHRLSLAATVTSLDGGVVIREHVGAAVRSIEEAVHAGERLVARLIRQGAEELLAAIRPKNHAGNDDPEPGE